MVLRKYCSRDFEVLSLFEKFFTFRSSGSVVERKRPVGWRSLVVHVEMVWLGKREVYETSRGLSIVECFGGLC